MNYYTLVASLPHLPAHFDVTHPPITRQQLNARLTMLDEEDAADLDQLADFLAWDRQPTDRTDEQVVHLYKQLKQETRHQLTLQIIEHRINIRTIVSALRRRRRGEPGPVGVGPLVEPIGRRWQQPQFGLQRQFPWIERFEGLMLAGEADLAARVLYEVTWQTWRLLASEFTFSFEAVLIYLARWSIIDRWTSRNAELGWARFNQLIEETLGDYADVKW